MTTQKMTDEQVTIKLEQLAKKQGVRILATRRFKHEDDWYLRYVLAHDEEGRQFVTWIYNATLGELGSFNHGHYFDYFYEDIMGSEYENRKKAWEDFYTRS